MAMRKRLLGSLSHNSSSGLAEILLTPFSLGLLGLRLVFLARGLHGSVDDLVPSFFRCHADSFPQARTWCRACGFQTAPLPDKSIT